MSDLKQLESIAKELIDIFDVKTPPIPVERMLQHPQAGMWDEVDISQLSSSFINFREHYSPRMSLARLLARHVATSAWGNSRGLTAVLEDEDQLYAFARMLMMPGDMVMALSSAARTPLVMSGHFEVPEEDATLRLQELSTYFKR